MRRKKEKEKTKYDKVTDLLLEEGDIVTIEDFDNCINKLKGYMLQAMLEGEIEHHVDKEGNNSKNGYSSKERSLRIKGGEITISMPRDRNGTFDPLIVKKRQRVLGKMDEGIVAMYAKGMTQRDIVELVKKAYGVNVSTSFVNDVIKSVSEEAERWRKRQLQSFYPFIYVDCLYVNIKNEETFISEKCPIYVIIGIDITGHKDVLTIEIGDTNSESATFWNGVFEDLKIRGVEDILYVSMDGLKGLPEAIETLFPYSKTQRCIVHLTRNLYQKCPKKEAKEIIGDFKNIYKALTKDEAIMEFENFKNKYAEKKYEGIVKMVQNDMEHILPLFEVPAEIRKVIYTTNPIESVNSALRKVTNGKGCFPNKESVFKVLYLRVNDLTKKWSKTIENWETILNQLIMLFGERVSKYLSI